MSFLKKKVKNTKSIFLGMVALVIVMVFCTFTGIKYRNEIWPTQDFLFEQKNIYRRLRADLEKARNQYNEYIREEDIVAGKIRTFYLVDDKVKADLYLRQRIEHAAKFSNLILKSMSSIQEKKIAKGTFSLEVSISAEGSFEKVISFLQELDKEKAKIYWVNCYLRPTVANKKEETVINVSGALRFLCTDGKLFKNEAKTQSEGKTG
ncbi:MAG: hypothetical protein PHV82_05750 [Victivallaceae bacterium]|nr:hypothetical protein [Victivallaceae bacterium]